MTARDILRVVGQRSWWSRLRQVAAVALVVAAATSFALFAPANRYIQAEGWRLATFDVWLNGPISETTLADVRAIDPNASIAALADVTPRYLEFEGRRAVVNNGRFFTDDSEVELLYPPSLVSRGHLPADLRTGQVVMDEITAETLGAAPGDLITANFISPDGVETNITIELAGTTVATGQLKDSIAGYLSADILNVIPADIPPVSSVFIATEAPRGYEGRVRDADGAELITFYRSDLLNQALAQANDLVDRFREIAYLAMAAIVLFVFLVRDLRAMLRLRTRPAAVLIALGVRPGTIARAILIEQFVLLSLATVVGVAVGAVWVLYGMHLPVPLGELGLVTVSLAVLASLAILCTVVLVARSLRTVPIAQLLFEGS